MSRHNKAILNILILVLGIFILQACLVFSTTFSQKPEETPPAQINAQTQVPGILPTSNQVGTYPDTNIVVTNTPTAQSQAPTATWVKPICFGADQMVILAVGVDNNDPDYLYGLADVIRIVKVDFLIPKISVLTIPRDLWVEIPNIKEEYADNVQFGKLNQAYFYGGPGMGYYTGENGGPGLLSDTLQLNYGLAVDKYVSINMSAFVKMVDAIGGIDLYLDQDWDGRPVDNHTVDLGYFSAGQHHMDGEEALRFVRIRKKYSEITRTDNQTLAICAIKEKLSSPQVITKIPKLILTLFGTVQTNLSVNQLGQLTCLLPYLKAENLRFYRFPDEIMVQGRIIDPITQKSTFVWDIPVEKIRQIVADFMADMLPEENSGEVSCP